MSGSGGVSIARTAIRGENRFYNPPPMRRMQQELQQQQMRDKQRRGEEEEEIVMDKASIPPSKTRKALGLKESKNRVVSGSEVSVGPSVSSGSSRVQNDGSNLDRFLKHTIPFVSVKSRNESECHRYFVLEDLWESFTEWSAYGAGVPIHMHESDDSTVQYYVPYLSGLQLYVDPSKSIRNEVEKLSNNVVDLSVSGPNRTSLKDQSSGETEISDPQGRLLFEYLEYDPPYARVPLAIKVLDLAKRFPELMTYRSCDLSPSSWVSVSWYPIYRIPVGPTLQNLDACFLTFHSLSTPSPQSAMSCSDSEPFKKLPLPTFGLSSYKLKASVWNQNKPQESQKLTSLLQAAEKWLKNLQVEHPDYNFFISNSSH